MRSRKRNSERPLNATAANANIAKEERLVLLKQREAETMEKSLDAQVKEESGSGEIRASAEGRSRTV